ncbi:MAG: hypothetical protein HYZ51_03845 [Candidatus Doudnabacteria bacterium]|nr:hypothetical protein [Candidatus Doudnabacteria bacterium]
MNIVYAKEFVKEYKKLLSHIQKLFKKQETIFRKDWRDSRLQIKKLIDHPFPFSFRITRNYRVLFVFVEAETALFAASGDRKEVYR